MEYRTPPLDAPLLVVAGSVVALDRATGKERWTCAIKGVARRYLIDDNRLFVFDSYGILNCIDIATGRMIGKVETGFDYASTMLVDGDHIYVSGDNQVIAIDLNGNILWRSDKVSLSVAPSLCGLGIPGGNVVQPDFSKS
jgi:outer membrane protein assembly factor BamB